MIFLSILAKTLALALVPLRPWLAVVCWLVGTGADLWVGWKAAGQSGLKPMLVRLACWQLAAVVLGWAAVVGSDYAAMRWKDGIPVFASMISGLLGCVGVASGSQGGLVCITTMAGPLEFSASLDGMGMQVPLILLVLCAGWLGCWGTSVSDGFRRLSWLAGLLIVVAVVRTTCVVMAANALFDFVGYETEELPYRPFMDQAGGVWAYLPFLLASGVLIGRWLPAPSVAPAVSLAGIPRWLRWAALPILLLLAGAMCWEPAGSPKAGKLVISTYHAQWSTCKRPNDREWYGADSGYN
jgi:hypothetical protein